MTFLSTRVENSSIILRYWESLKDHILLVGEHVWRFEVANEFYLPLGLLSGMAA